MISIPPVTRFLQVIHFEKNSETLRVHDHDPIKLSRFQNQIMKFICYMMTYFSAKKAIILNDQTQASDSIDYIIH